MDFSTEYFKSVSYIHPLRIWSDTGRRQVPSSFSLSEHFSLVEYSNACHVLSRSSSFFDGAFYFL